MRRFWCGCGQELYFENTVCSQCGALVGYEPQERLILGFKPHEPAAGAEPSSPPLFSHPTTGAAYKSCKNYYQENVCNWMLPAESTDVFCLSCSLTQTIPDLDANPKNRMYWARMETAKRYLLHSLLTIGLPVVPKTIDPENGLSFAFMADKDPDSEFTEPLPVDNPVTTGHDNGHITINLAEADDVARRRHQIGLGESYRTLLGHFRHEVGHYYWDVLVANSENLEDVRALFGDEQMDYGEALKKHYNEGPAADWPQRCVSAYAASHPWEDWAETFAHYLHMVDTLDTAHHWGVAVQGKRVAPFGTPEGVRPKGSSGRGAWNFDILFQDWMQLGLALNALSRSLGTDDAYPFILPEPVESKLALVHGIIQDYAAHHAQRETQPQQAQPQHPTPQQPQPQQRPT